MVSFIKKLAAPALFVSAVLKSKKKEGESKPGMMWDVIICIGFIFLSKFCLTGLWKSWNSPSSFFWGSVLVFTLFALGGKYGQKKWLGYLGLIILIVVIICHDLQYKWNVRHNQLLAESGQTTQNTENTPASQPEPVISHTKTTRYIDFKSDVINQYLVPGTDYEPVGDGGITVQYASGGSVHIDADGAPDVQMGYHDAGTRKIIRDNPNVSGVNITTYWDEVDRH